MKTLFLSAAFAALALGANAQSAISFGVEAGANLNSLRTSVNGEKTKSSTKAGPRAGVFANIGFGEQLGVQVGLVYSQKGGKNESDFTTTSTVGGSTISAKVSGSYETTISYVELPVNVVYHFNNEQSGFFLMAGAYGAVAVNGNAKLNESTTTVTTTTSGGQTTTATSTIPAGDKVDLEIGGDEAKDDIRRFDLGFQAGAGYQTKMGLLFRAQYILGAMNINSQNNSDNAVRTSAIALTVGYRFGGR
jgi:hypothetical protein